MGLIDLLLITLVLPTDYTLTIACILYMNSLHTILEGIQALSKQINFNMVFTATNILIFTLFHKVRFQAFKFPLLNYYIWMDTYKPEVE